MCEKRPMGRPMVDSILEVDKVATTIWQCRTSAFVGFLKLLLTWKSEFSSIRQYFWTVLCTVATLKLKLWKNINNKNWSFKLKLFIEKNKKKSEKIRWFLTLKIDLEWQQIVISSFDSIYVVRKCQNCDQWSIGFILKSYYQILLTWKKNLPTVLVINSQ